jgi:hypothetical protein
MIMEFTQLVIIAILVESIWENLKMIYKKQKLNINMIGSLILAILVCILAKIDIFSIVGINLEIPIIGYVLTGIICSRGANFINDLFSKLKGE